ncbi:hypothetical protein KCP76_21900 [Salmonella enterica subsp. enterica serovar Weltevreden]|nr:hypothetical protein KCP76_21900 [Salmonella enterica subsp. enterica serovar Weltevreden]
MRVITHIKPRFNTFAYAAALAGLRRLPACAKRYRRCVRGHFRAKSCWRTPL